MARGNGIFDFFVNATTAGQGKKARIHGVGHSLNRALKSGQGPANKLLSDVSQNRCANPTVFSRSNSGGGAKPNAAHSFGSLGGQSLYCWVTRDEKGNVVAIGGCFWL